MKILHDLGVDISKKTLESVLLSKNVSQERVFANNEAGLDEVIQWLGPRIKRCRAFVEATSRYHFPLVNALVEHGCRVQVFNPRQARHLASGLGFLDKTDAVDAAMLAQASQLLGDRRDKACPNELAQELRDESRAIDATRREAGEFAKRREGLAKDSAAYKTFTKVRDQMLKTAKEAEEAWVEHAKQHEEIYRRFTLAWSVRSVGVTTARIVAVELPADADASSVRKICAYAGLVPRKNQSGDKRLPDRIRDGNAHLRTGLFMSATLGVYRHGQYREFYDRLIKNGKDHLQAIVAVMHKLLRTIVVVIKRNTPWEKVRPKMQSTA